MKKLQNSALLKIIFFISTGLMIGLYFNLSSTACTQQPLMCQNGLLQEPVSINSCEYVSCDGMLDKYGMNPNIIDVIKNTTGIDFRIVLVSSFIVIFAWLLRRKKIASSQTKDNSLLERN